jgi:glutaredoxin
MKTLTVFYVPACPFSAATIAFLASKGAEYQVVNLDLHPEERERLSQRVEKLETPTLEIGSDVHVAPPLSELKKMLAAWGLPDDAARYQQLQQLQHLEECSDLGART